MRSGARRGVMPALTAVVLAVAVGHAADVIVVDRDARTDLALLVYAQSDGSIVRDTREVTLPRGEVALRFVDVAARLEPRTVVLRSHSGDVDVHTQRFRNDLASPEALLTRWIGNEVELVQEDDTLRTQVTPATLLAVRPQQIFRIGDRIVLGHPGRIRLPPSDGELLLEPTLTWTLTSPARGRAALEASYSTTGLGWEADYAFTVDADATHADLVAWVTITNASGTSYDDATVAVVAGDVQRVARAVRPVARAMALETSPAADAARPVESTPFEYHRYDLPGRISLAADEVTQIRLLTATGVPVEKRYLVESHARWHRGPHPDGEQPLPVRVRLVFTNDTASALGRLLPAGVVRVHTTDDEGRSTFLGEDRIGHTARGEVVRLSTGTATDVVASRRQVERRQVSVKPYEVETTTEVRLRNHTPRNITVQVRDTIVGTWSVVDTTHPTERVDATTLGITVAVAAEGEETVRYRVQVGR